MELIALYVHPKNSNHLRSHLRAIMALDQSRLGLENKFLENKSGRFFCVRQVYVIKSCQPVWWRGTSLLYFLYIESELKQYTMRRCFYHTGLRQNAITVFHNFARQIALIQYSGRSKHAWAFSESFKKFPKSPVTASRFSLLTSAKFELRAVKCLHINRVTFQHNKEFMFIFYLLVL